MPMGLTKQQAATLDFIKEELSRSGVAPNFEEIQEHIGVSSKSRVFWLLNDLQERGRIRRLPHRARAIEIIDDDQGDAVTAVRAWIMSAPNLSTRIKRADTICRVASAAAEGERTEMRQTVNA